MFSDETMFTCEGKQARYVRRSRNESISEHHMVQRTKTAAKRMYWGCMTYHGVGSITPFHGTMDANKYMHIIKNKVPPQDISYLFYLLILLIPSIIFQNCYNK